MKRTISLVLAVSLSLIVLQMAVAAVALAAPPGLPSSLWGQALVSGANVPDGTVVSAWIGGVKYVQTTTLTYGGYSMYALDVPADDASTVAKEGGAEGDAIVLKIGATTTADQTGTWHGGSDVSLNLTGTPQPPAPPSEVSATNGGYLTKVRISWAASEGATQYNVYRNTTNSTSGVTLLGTTTALYYDDTTAATATIYWYWVKARNAVGPSAFSASDSGYRKQAQPTGVSATDGTYTDKVRVSWTAAAGATGYDVYRNTSNASAGASLLGTAAASPYDDTTAEPGTTYWYWVKAKNAAYASAFSGSNSGYRAQPAPTNVKASDGTIITKVRVTWTAAPGATEYKVYRNTTNASASATFVYTTTGTTIDDSKAAVATTYWYWVKAKNAMGESAFSAGDSGYRKQATPTGVSATDGTYPDKVRVSWTAAAGATNYMVYRNTTNSSAGATLVGTVAASPYNDTTAATATIYWYWVKAKNALSTSAFSAGNSGYRKQAAPTGVSATDGTYSDKVQVTWTAAAGATGYDVYRNTTNASGSATLAGSAAGSPYNDTTAEPGTTYWYWVKAKNAAYASAFSGSDSGYRAQPAPAGVSASNGTYTDKVRVTWTAAPGATEYKVYRNTANASASATLVYTTTGTTYDDATAAAATSYWYWVKAKNAMGESAFSLGDSGYRKQVAPTGASATDGTYADKVQVTWTAAADATSYTVYRNTTNTTAGATVLGTTAGTTFDDTTAAVGVTYYYWVKAKNALSTSVFSAGDSGYAGTS